MTSQRGGAPPIRPIDDASLEQAAAILRAGRLTAFPTETVYGLGADATNPSAIARLYAAKGRPSANPLIAHVADRDAAEAIAVFNATARALADAFWPGPLTIVLPARPDAVCAAARAGLPTVGVRAPQGPAQALLARFGRPVAAPSANPSGKLSPTTADAVADGLGDAVDLILDGGPCAVGLESTILGLDDGWATLLRPGGLPVEAIEAMLGAPIAARGVDAGLTAPGQLASHYAPIARLRLNADAPRSGEAWLGFGPDPVEIEAETARNLSPSGDLAAAAATLFGHLRALDAGDPSLVIAVARIPETGLGRAINDRLRRAAAPRPSDS